ncbi:MAG: hypothetical protein RPU62_08900, partial [Candidatus Sedimenticola sp. (ex Thyasira tokunagai)]
FPLTGRRVRMPTLLPLWRAARTTGKQCGLTATGDYQPSLRSPWLAAIDPPHPNPLPRWGEGTFATSSYEGEGAVVASSL